MRSLCFLPEPRGTWGALIAAFSLLLLDSQLSLASNVEEDDEEPVGSISLSVPGELTRVKRQLADSTGFSLLAGLSAYVGSDDNVYRSPAETASASDAWGNWVYLRADSRLGANRFLNTVNWKQARYPRHGTVDAAYGSLSNWYTRPLGANFSIELDLDASRQNDDAATISGEKYSRDYAYWRYAAESVLAWEPSRRHRVRLRGEGVLKNYDETTSQNSIDWNQWLVTMSYRLRLLAGQSITCAVARGERRYDSEPASTVSGRELEANPVEHHRYGDLVVTYTAPIHRRVVCDLGYARTTKHDLFQGYENRVTEGYQGGVGLRPIDRLELRIDATRAWRDYAHLLGDGGRKLVYRTQEVGVGARLRIGGPCWAFANVSRYERDTNKSTGTLYRDYSGTLSRGGMSVFF